MTADTLQLFVALLATGRYLAILPVSMLRFSGKRLGVKVLPVDFPTRPWPIAIVTLKKRTLSPVVHHFIDCVREVAKPLANQTALGAEEAKQSLTTLTYPIMRLDGTRPIPNLVSEVIAALAVRSAPGQSRRLSDVRGMSASPPTPDVSLRCSDARRAAASGRRS